MEGAGFGATCLIPEDFHSADAYLNSGSLALIPKTVPRHG